MSNREGVKFSGLVSTQRITPPQGGAVPANFGRPANAAPLQQPSAVSAAPIPVYTGIGTPEVGVEMLWLLELLDDSPFQTRLKILPQRIDEVGASMEATRQVDPIEVRVVTPGRGQIIKGHTRKRAALSRGWTTIRVIVVALNDKEAADAVLIDNTGDTPHDYEYGRAFRLRLDNKLASNQTELGTMVGMSQAHVSKCLGMLDLPRPVLDILDETPGLFGVTTAATIKALWAQFPTDTDTIVKGIMRIKEGADQNQLKAWVIQQTGRSNAQSQPNQNKTILSPTGQPACVRIIKNRDLTYRISDKALDIDNIAAKVDAYVESLIQGRVEP